MTVSPKIIFQEEKWLQTRIIFPPYEPKALHAAVIWSRSKVTSFSDINKACAWKVTSLLKLNGVAMIWLTLIELYFGESYCNGVPERILKLGIF